MRFLVDPLEQNVQHCRFQQTVDFRLIWRNRLLYFWWWEVACLAVETDPYDSSFSLLLRLSSFQECCKPSPGSRCIWRPDNKIQLWHCRSTWEGSLNLSYKCQPSDPNESHGKLGLSLISEKLVITTSLFDNYLLFVEHCASCLQVYRNSDISGRVSKLVKLIGCW